VSAEKYANLSVAMPPLAEQRAIAAFLDRETARTDTLISKIQEAIEKLKEYRTTLISAAVTGKIDVRNEKHVSTSNLRVTGTILNRKATLQVEW
jgi:hypothetical protein